MCSRASPTTATCSAFAWSSRTASPSSTPAWSGHGGINIFVTEVDALYQELKSRGARTLNEPRDYPYGMRDFNVQDLDGNDLCFGMESTAR